MPLSHRRRNDVATKGKSDREVLQLECMEEFAVAARRATFYQTQRPIAP